MKRIDHYSVFRVAILLLVINCCDSLAVQQPANVMTSNKLIRLQYWQIAKDQEPGNTLHNPPASLWLPLDSAGDNHRYDEGNWILQTGVAIGDSLDTQTTWGLFLTDITTAYEVYWDGAMVGRNGIIGADQAREKPGTLRFSLTLPPHLMTAGNRVLVLRVSQHHNYSSWKWFYGDCSIAPYDVGLRSMIQQHYEAFFTLGILCIPFLLNLFLYFARENRTEHLLFSLICLVVILDSVTSLIPQFTDVPTTYIHWEAWTYQTLTLLFATLLPAFLVHLFSFSRKVIGLVIAINLITYVFFTNILTVFDRLSLTVLVISSLIALWALFKGREGSITIVIGLMAGWAAYYFNFAFDGLATVMVICTSISIAQQFVRKERAEREAHLRSVHLENELLRKHINPHFLMNTLTSVIVWLRKDPRSAIKLVEALAEEFRVILTISPLTQIPVRQEIDLCKAHLTIMSYRKGADYKLETKDMVEDENVPPMLFHTLIENGISHGYENKIQGTFVLERRNRPGCIQYVLSNDGDGSCDESRDSSGVGLRYVRSRLEESYPNRWALTSHKQAEGWETIIEIRDT